MNTSAARIFIDQIEVWFTTCECGSKVLALSDRGGGLSAWHLGAMLNLDELRLIILRHVGAIASIERRN